MHDKYRLTDLPQPHEEPSGRARPHDEPLTGDISGDGLPAETDWVTSLLWVALAICAGLNVLVSIVSPDNLVPSIVLGAVALGCIGLLVSRYLGRRHS